MRAGCGRDRRPADSPVRLGNERFCHGRAAGDPWLVGLFVVDEARCSRNGAHDSVRPDIPPHRTHPRPCCRRRSRVATTATANDRVVATSRTSSATMSRSFAVRWRAPPSGSAPSSSRTRRDVSPGSRLAARPCPAAASSTASHGRGYAPGRRVPPVTRHRRSRVQRRPDERGARGARGRAAPG